MPTEAVVPMNSSEKNADATVGTTLSPSFVNEDCFNEFDNIHGLHDEHADVLSYMANV